MKHEHLIHNENFFEAKSTAKNFPASLREGSMNKKHAAYFGLVLVITLLAFALDIWSSSTPFAIVTKTISRVSESPETFQIVEYPWSIQVANLAKNFLYGLSAAIFVTVFIVNKLELAQRTEKELELNKLNDAINVNVFDSLFKTIIPEEIFKIIKQDIIENKVIRKQAKWVYNFEKCDEGIRCTHTVRYELHNLSQAAVSDPVRLDLNPLGGKPYDIILAECTSTDGKHLVHYDKLKSIKENINILTDGKRMSVEYTITIPPGSFVEYKTVYQQTYTDEITDYQGTKLPLIGLDIIATYPEGFDFDVVPVMSSPPKLTVESATQKIYRVDGGILPQQGVIFYLKRKSIEPEQQILI